MRKTTFENKKNLAKVIARQKIKASLVLAAFLCLATGCGKRETVQLATEDNTEQIATVTDVAENDNEIPEHITETKEYGKAKLKIDADVIADSYGKMRVCNQEKATISEEEMAELAKSLFDGGEYEIKKPYAIMSKNELEEIYNLEVVNGIIPAGELEAQEIAEYISDYEYGDKKDGNPYEAELDESHILQEIKGEDSYECYLEGFVDGEIWTLRYRSNPYCLEFKPKNSAISMKYSNYESMDYNKDSNATDYDTAKEKAEELILSLGIDDMAVFDAKQMANYTDGTYINGYIFVFTKTIRGDDLGVCSMFNKTIVDDLFATQEYAVVALDNDQVYFASVYNRYNNVDTNEAESSANEYTTMLEYSKIEDIANDYFSFYFEEYYKDMSVTNYIVSVQLRYLTVNYNGNYVWMPCWVYFDTMNGGSNVLEVPMIAINAVDGSIITMDWDERGLLFGDGRIIFGGYQNRYRREE